MDSSQTVVVNDCDYGSKDPDDLLFKLVCDNNQKVSVGKFLKSLRDAGLSRTDPRLQETIRRIRKLTSTYDEDSIGELLLDKQTFTECIRDCFVLVWRAFTGDFVIPEFTAFCKIINDIYHSCSTIVDGKVANYIPQLAKYSSDYWGVSICTIDGQRYQIGDVDIPFTIQSCSKPITYSLTSNLVGPDTIHKYVGHEPSGESFNHIKLSVDNKPFNPMINAGAIAVAALFENHLSPSERFCAIHDKYKQMAGGEFIGFSNSVFLSEKEAGHRNYALGHYLKENKCFPDNINLSEVMDFYFQICSIEINCKSGAVLAATLANGGNCPITDENILDYESVRNTLSLMHSCGMYDYSGTFAFKVGLPAKSSVSGAILIVVPNVLGMCLWSPAIDRIGNSARGIAFCEELVRKFNFHNYDNLKYSSEKKIDPRFRQADMQGNQVSNLLFAAYNGDITALRRMALSNQNMAMSDYDGRTALHLSMSEGHMDCVKFLVERCNVPLHPVDRWGNTPLDDAIKFKKDVVKEYLEQRLSKQIM